MVGENDCNFIVLNYKSLQTIIAMITGSKVMEVSCMAGKNVGRSFPSSGVGKQSGGAGRDPSEVAAS